MKEHNNLIDYIEKNFEEGNLKVQIKNLKKLVSYLTQNKISLDISLEDAGILLDGSPKLNKLIDTILSQKKRDMYLEDENIYTLAMVYASKYGMELDEDAELYEPNVSKKDERILDYYFDANYSRINCFINCLLH